MKVKICDNCERMIQGPSVEVHSIKYTQRISSGGLGKECNALDFCSLECFEEYIRKLKKNEIAEYKEDKAGREKIKQEATYK